MYAITLGQTVLTLTSLLKKLVCNNYKGKGKKQNSCSGRIKFSQAEKVVLGLLDTSLCNNFDNDKDTDICITRWKDSKVVTMASTYAGVNPI